MGWVGRGCDGEIRAVRGGAHAVAYEFSDGFVEAAVLSRRLRIQFSDQRTDVGIDITINHTTSHQQPPTGNTRMPERSDCMTRTITRSHDHTITRSALHTCRA